MCFYKDVLESMNPKYGVLETDMIEIERSTGTNVINCKVGEEEFNITNPQQHYYWNQNFVGLKCRLYKENGNSYVKEYNIAKLIKKDQ